ncbi:uncharacterized protein [Spinacia oleracea]|uniref:Reverse transcriptase domain-containing protein n=1 Tax=Spinacia oleracea TaxID=3562 RepID=A0ABM3QQV7_SPIOL|nr:uncharacterized protein LOC130461592 [Spinacia oleracea]
MSSEKEFKYHSRCKKLKITHMMFADDLLMFARADVPYVTALFGAFTKFSTASGLNANLHKSEVYTADVPDDISSQTVARIGIQKGNFPFRYLGVPLTTRKLSFTDCNPLIERTIFVMPKKVMKELRFKESVGAFCGQQDRLWVKWIHTYYVKQFDFWTMPITSGITWSLRKIWQYIDVLMQAGGVNQCIGRELSVIVRLVLRGLFITWLALQKRLPTKSRLISWNISMEIVNPVRCMRKG